MNCENTKVFSFCGALLLTVLVAGCNRPVVLRIETFGATGDGVHNDAPAVLAAVDAIRAAGRPARLVFSAGKTYRLGRQDQHDAQFDFSGLEKIEVDGQGATLLLHPVHGLARFYGSRNIVFKNFVIQHDPLPFMQGTIVAVDPAGGSFLWEIQAGFPLPPPEEWMRQEGHFFDNPAAALPEPAEWAARNGDRTAWQWGIVIEAASRKLKADIPNHLFVETVAPAGTGNERVFRVSVTEPYREHVGRIRAGERFVLPRFWRTQADYSTLRDKGWMFEQNIQIRKSADIAVENVAFYSARPGMVFGVRYNDGLVTIRGCTVTWLPGSDRLIASWRDGVHCKNNRMGPLIEGCRFEGLFDDSINLSADAVMAKSILAPDRFEMTDAVFEAGDSVGVFHPKSGIWDTGFSVVGAEGPVVVLDRPVDGIVSGTMTPRQDIHATQFYNLSRANDGFLVRNNFFGIQRRHAVLARCRGVIEGNVIDGVCGRALEFSNESGNFYEGPFPRGLRVAGNRISDTAMAPVLVQTKSMPGVPPAAPVTGGIMFEGNRIVFDAGAPVEMECVEGVRFKGNAFLRTDGRAVSDREAVKTDPSCRNVRFN